MSGNNKYKRHRNSQPPVEVRGDKEVLSSPIESLGLPEETLTLLKNNRFNTVYDIARRTERDMFRVQTFNKKHLIAVKKAINAKGLDFIPYEKTEQKAERQNDKQDKNQPREQNQDVKNGRRDNEKNPSQAKQHDRKTQTQPVRQQPSQKKSPQKEERRPRTELPVEEWIKVSKNGKWGFSNGLKTVIEPRFDEVFCFKEGVACVDDGGKFGYIDTAGNYVIEPRFECAMSFSEGMAVFFEGEKCGYIDREGQVVLPAKYEAATAFENGRAKVKEFGKWSTIDPTGATLWSK